MKFRNRSLLFAFALGISLAGCMQNPIDGRYIKNRQAKISFSGTHLTANKAIKIQALNNSTGAYTTLATATSGATAIPDSAGANWYTWSKDVSLPTSRSYWAMGGGSTTNRRATITTRAYDSTADIVFSTFNLYGALCLNTYLADDRSGGDIIADCSSGNTSRLSVKCGGLGEPCCPSGLACDVPITHYDPLFCKNSLCVREDMQVRITPDGSVVEPDDGIPCDGVMEGAPCEKNTGCVNGLTTAMGEYECDANDNARCNAKVNVDWCANCNHYPSNTLCGECRTASCMSDSQCEPGSRCASGVCSRIPGCVKKPSFCWPVRESPSSLPPDGAKTGDMCQ